MAVVQDREGTKWSIRRKWWPYGDVSSGIDELFDLILVVPLALIWPFWIVVKFLGARWVIIVNRAGQGVRREKVRGWRRSKRRMAQIALEVSTGGGSWVL